MRNIFTRPTTKRLAIYTGGGNWRFTIRDLHAKVVREVTAFQSGGTTTWTWHRDHIFRDGLLLATVLPEGTQHYHLDHLGTPRLVTDGTGRKLGVHAYYPFGDELNLGLGERLSPERLKYTGHERDDGSNGTSLDYMHARGYGSITGRFLSVDPTITKAAMRAPQFWSRYAYAGNNPMNMVDPDGRLFQLDEAVNILLGHGVTYTGEVPTMNGRIWAYQLQQIRDGVR